MLVSFKSLLAVMLLNLQKVQRGNDVEAGARGTWFGAIYLRRSG
jgi:hypothetical protein